MVFKAYRRQALVLYLRSVGERSKTSSIRSCETRRWFKKLSISGSNRLAKDCVEVEAALRSHLLFFGPLSSDDAKIANLHAFKRLMFCDNKQILSVVGKSNSPDADKMLLLEIHHLYSQCDSTKITTPWARAGMNPKQYYTWWKSQKDVKEVLRGVQGSLDASKADDERGDDDRRAV